MFLSATPKRSCLQHLSDYPPVKFLLTNDDGIEAPGLASLYESLRRHLTSDDSVIVVAPDQCRSECGHSVTTGRSLTLTPRPDVATLVEEQRSQQGFPNKATNGHSTIPSQWYSIDGTPVDCIRVALATMASDVDAVFSGINAGANLGACLLVSGTFAAAREAAFQGLPAMAVSQLRHPDVPQNWDHAPEWLQSIIATFKRNLDDTTSQKRLWNVNLPALAESTPIPPTIQCDVDQNPIPRRVELGALHSEKSSAGNPVRFELDFHGRPHAKDTDIHHCFRGAITVSHLRATAG
ncbi:5'/3'-nucleotidase SurE [Rubripirellula amarantea]|nr:5'/3'-nucleotidase SurE [Rubripirellula amarantea]